MPTALKLSSTRLAQAAKPGHSLLSPSPLSAFPCAKSHLLQNPMKQTGDWHGLICTGAHVFGWAAPEHQGQHQVLLHCTWLVHEPQALSATHATPLSDSPCILMAKAFFMSSMKARVSPDGHKAVFHLLHGHNLARHQWTYSNTSAQVRLYRHQRPENCFCGVDSHCRQHVTRVRPKHLQVQASKLGLQHWLASRALCWGDCCGKGCGPLHPNATKW